LSFLRLCAIAHKAGPTGIFMRFL